MSFKDWRFYGFVAASVVAAGILVAMLVGGEVGGTRVAELRSHQNHQR